MISVIPLISAAASGKYCFNKIPLSLPNLIRIIGAAIYQISS